MKRMRIGKSGIEASVVGLGAWAIGGDSNWGPSDDAESIRTIHRALDLGVNLIDTAPAYGLGHGEEVVGRALKGKRQRYILATKCGIRWDISEGALLLERDGVRIVRNTRPERLKEEIHASLRRLQTEYIDIYIVHWQEVPEFPCPIADTMGFLMDLKKEGKIRAIGASNVSREQFLEYTGAGELDLIQERYSMLHRKAESVFFPLCKEHQVTFQAYSPLERGALTDAFLEGRLEVKGLARSKIPWFHGEAGAKLKEVLSGWKPLCEKYSCTLTQLVIAWTTAQGTGSNVNVLCGARTISQIEENAKGGSITLEKMDVDRMRQDIEALVPA
ncbi:MAG: aldo/keto reductase [Spirochaetes bacterium]|nr:aldo/keto reductase [Spirochaetota bacterium]